MSATHQQRQSRHRSLHCTSLRASSALGVSSTREDSIAGKFDELGANARNSWTRDLLPDPDTSKHAPNRISREVKSGHFVLVDPEPLEEPVLVASTPAMVDGLGFSEEECHTELFARVFSGDLQSRLGFKAWATPYALSIYGHEMYDNCPFGNGNGYGDGRALSIIEAVSKTGEHWELQLKGAGRTPFCRGGDGRAVLRSSVREFLVSEAMHHLGIATTRAVSLVVSRTQHSLRPWYSHSLESSQGPDLDALARRLYKEQRDVDFDTFPEDVKDKIKVQLSAQLNQARSGKNPDVMQEEQCAITCRAARSFLRVGHIDLFSRRARQGHVQGLHELEMIVEHALQREYPDVAPGKSLQVRIVSMLRVVSQRLALMVTGWVRVGYVQGNFNADNCLIAGRTMDYGPFGFVERYEPLWNMWTGGDEKYGFLNQPNAAYKNFETLAMAMNPLLDDEHQAEITQIVGQFHNDVGEALSDMWRQKLGLSASSDRSLQLFGSLEPLLRAAKLDWTIFWRSLAVVAERSAEDLTALDLLEPLRECFYEDLSSDDASALVAWLREWLAAIRDDGSSGEMAASLIRRSSPKYVPREWMLVDAYTAAAKGDFSLIADLQQLFRHPYDEQLEFEARFYRRTPSEAANRGGTSWMT